MSDETTYSVYDADTGDRLPGWPTDHLVELSIDAPSGIVCAEWDRHADVWRHIHVDEAGPYDRRVYVLAD